MNTNEKQLNLAITKQPDGVSCGPTCLNAIYRYLGENIDLKQSILEAPYLETGGTLAVLLGCDALKKGYEVTLNSFNVNIVDPTWFKLSPSNLIDKLQTQLSRSTHSKIINTTRAYIDFLKMEGKISFSEITFDLIRRYIDNDTPLISGVNATWLYQNMRDYTDENNQVAYDEWLGEATGHFVVLHGYESTKKTLHIADPYISHTLSNDHHYQTTFSHWLHAHLLGINSYDAELIAITPH